MDKSIEKGDGPKRGSSTGVLCADCEHLNPPGSTKCGECGAALYVACPHCGKETQTVLPRCTHCQERLRPHKRHGPLWHRFFSGGQKVTFTQIMLILLLLLFVYLFLTRLV